MFFKVYDINQVVTKKEEEEKVVTLAFKPSSTGMDVIAVDEGGKIIDSGGYLINFRKDGTLYRYSGINESLGFQLDSERRIVICNGY